MCPLYPDLAPGLYPFSDRASRMAFIHCTAWLAGWLADCVALVAMEANSQAENSLCVHSTEAVKQNIQAHAATHTCV